MIIALSIIGTILIIFVIGKINLSIRFDRQVKQLFSLSQSLASKTFSYVQLAGLPEPVQKYFRRVLKDGQPYISYVRLTHDGQFKTGLDKKWINIHGEQYFTASRPGFIWKGTTTTFTARDMYIGDKGRLVVSLVSLFTVVDGHGENYNEGELQRWLAESVWFPTNLLPSERLTWEAIDANTAKLVFNYKDVSITYWVKFTDQGEIVEMKTERFMDKERKETWSCIMAGYNERNGVIVPTRCEAIWKLDKGDYPYASFNLKTIEYNNPRVFQNTL